MKLGEKSILKISRYELFRLEIYEASLKRNMPKADSDGTVIMPMDQSKLGRYKYHKTLYLASHLVRLIDDFYLRQRCCGIHPSKFDFGIVSRMIQVKAVPTVRD